MGWRFWRVRRVRDDAGSDECRELQAFFQEYVDSELDDDAAIRVASHLEACRGCGLEAGTYRAIKASLARMERPSPETLSRLHAFAETLDDQA